MELIFIFEQELGGQRCGVTHDRLDKTLPCLHLDEEILTLGYLAPLIPVYFLAHYKKIFDFIRKNLLSSSDYKPIGRIGLFLNLIGDILRNLNFPQIKSSHNLKNNVNLIEQEFCDGFLDLLLYKLVYSYYDCDLSIAFVDEAERNNNVNPFTVKVSNIVQNMDIFQSIVDFSNVNVNFKVKSLILGAITDSFLALPIKMKDHIIKILNILKVVAQCELPSLVDQFSNKRQPQGDGAALKKIKKDFDSNDEGNDLDRDDDETNETQDIAAVDGQVQTDSNRDADGDDVDALYDFRAGLLEAYSGIVMVS
jgi:hypothetical protein